MMDNNKKIFEANLRAAAREIVLRDERRKKASSVLKKLRTAAVGAAAVVIVVSAVLLLQTAVDRSPGAMQAVGTPGTLSADNSHATYGDVSSADFDVIPLDGLLISPSAREIRKSGDAPEPIGMYKENELPIFFNDGLIKDYYAYESDGKVYLPVKVADEIFKGTDAYTDHPLGYGEYYTASDSDGGPVVSIYVSDGIGRIGEWMISGAKHVIISMTNSDNIIDKNKAVYLFRDTLIKSYERRYGAFEPLEEQPDLSSDTEVYRYLITKSNIYGENDDYYLFYLKRKFCLSKKTGNLYLVLQEDIGSDISFMLAGPDMIGGLDYDEANGENHEETQEDAPDGYNIRFWDLGGLNIIPPSGANGETVIQRSREGAEPETVSFGENDVPIFINEAFVTNLFARIEDGKVYLPDEIVSYVFRDGGSEDYSSFDAAGVIRYHDVSTGADINIPYWDVYMSSNYLIPGVRHVAISITYGDPIRTAEEAAEYFRSQMIQAYADKYGGFEPLYEEPGSDPYDEKEYLRYRITTCKVNMENDTFYVINFPWDGTWSYYVGKYTDNIYRVYHGAAVNLSVFDPTSPYALSYAG